VPGRRGVFIFGESTVKIIAEKEELKNPMLSPKVLLKVAASESCFLKVANFQKFLKDAF
jgi:hypothetical protein